MADGTDAREVCTGGEESKKVTRWSSMNEEVYYSLLLDELGEAVAESPTELRC